MPKTAKLIKRETNKFDMKLLEWHDQRCVNELVATRSFIKNQITRTVCLRRNELVGGKVNIFSSTEVLCYTSYLFCLNSN